MPPPTSERVFVSFASRDVALANSLIDFLRLGCNLPEEQVFSTARPGALAPGVAFGEAIRTALETAILSVHVLTPAYYESHFCLGELGAVWIKKIGHVPLLVPPVDFASLDGVQLGEQALRIDVEHDLDQLREVIDRQLGQRTNIAQWYRQREIFLDRWRAEFAVARASLTKFTRAAANVPAAQRPLLLARHELSEFLPPPRRRLVRGDGPHERARTVFISGIDCNEIVKSNASFLKQVLSEPTAEVRVLLLDPAADPMGEFLPHIDHFADGAAFRVALRASLSKLEDLKRSARGDLQFRLLPFFPAFQFFVTDPDAQHGTFKVEGYTPLEGDGLGRPHFVLGPELDAWRTQLLRVWDRYWSLAREPASVDTPRIAPQTSYAAVQEHHEEAFRLDTCGRLWHRWYPSENDEWSEWNLMPAPASTGVAATSIGTALHLFLANVDGRIERRSWRDGRGWGTWTTLPGGGQAVAGPIAALSRTPEHLEIFAANTAGTTVHRWAFWSEEHTRWDWSEWHPFEPTP